MLMGIHLIVGIFSVGSLTYGVIYFAVTVAGVWHHINKTEEIGNQFEISRKFILTHTVCAGRNS